MNSYWSCHLCGFLELFLMIFLVSLIYYFIECNINALIFNIVLVSLSLSSLSYGRVSRIQDKARQANCPEGWVSNRENTRCFKLLTFERPKTFSHGFKLCNELEETEIITFKGNGVTEKDKYPVTLATVHRKSDDEAIKKVLAINSRNIKTMDGCFVGLRKYAFFKYPPGWYWIDSNQQIAIKETNIEWTSDYNANWLVKFKFPFEKCGFYDRGGLGRRPCWLVDSELSCSVCATVAYDSGGLNPNNYSELIKQADDIMNKEPKLDSPIYRNLNCSDPLTNTSIILCQNVSTILDSTWNRYRNSLIYPESAINWGYGDEKQAENANNINEDSHNKKKTFVWDQGSDFSSALSDELKFESLTAQQRFYTIDRIHENKLDKKNHEEKPISKQNTNHTDEIFLPTSKAFSDSVQGSNVQPLNKINSITNLSDKLFPEMTKVNSSSNSINIEEPQSLEPFSQKKVFTSTNTTSTNTKPSNTNYSGVDSADEPGKVYYNKSDELIADSREKLLPSANLLETRNRTSTDNVRTNNYVKYNNKDNPGPVISEQINNSENDLDSSLLGFGAGESIGGVDSKVEREIEPNLGKEEPTTKMKGSTEVDSFVGENKYWILIFIVITGIVFLLLALCIILLIKRKSKDKGQNLNIESNNRTSKNEKVDNLQLASIQPTFGKKSSRALPLSNRMLDHDVNLTKSEKGVLSIEDTSFSPEYMNTSDSMEESKSIQYCIAHSQANTLQLHSGSGITVNYDTRSQINRSNFIKSPKYHDFYYSETNKE